MINVLLFDTDKLIELYKNIGDELNRREEQFVSLTIVTSNKLKIEGCNIKSKLKDIQYILGAFGKCCSEITSADELTFYFEDNRDLQDLVKEEEAIMKRINGLFVHKFRGPKGAVFLSRPSEKQLAVLKPQISLQAEEIYDILREYGPCKIINNFSPNEFIVEFLGSEDLDDLIKEKRRILDKIQQLFI